jgi:hypothetical protein
MGPVGSSETPVLNYIIERNNPEDGKLHSALLIWSVSLKVHMIYLYH